MKKIIAYIVVTIVVAVACVMWVHDAKVKREEADFLKKESKLIDYHVQSGIGLSRDEYVTAILIGRKLEEDGKISAGDFDRLIALMRKRLAVDKSGDLMYEFASGFRSKPQLSEAQKVKLGDVLMEVMRSTNNPKVKYIVLHLVFDNRLKSTKESLRPFINDPDPKVASLTKQLFGIKP